MPEISRFFGIVVRMYWNDHEPAHLHAEYAEDEVLLDIETLGIVRGSVKRRALAMVLEWSALHRSELRANWERAREGLPLVKIEPLD